MAGVLRISLTNSVIEKIQPPAKGRSATYDTKKPKLCIRTTSKGTKTFYYVTKHKGKTEWIRLGRYPDLSPAAARTAADFHAGEFAKGVNTAEVKRQRRAEWTVQKAWDMYRARHIEQGGKSLATIDGYWRLYFCQWSAKRLSQVSNSMAEELQDRILENRSGATANRVIAIGRALFNFAIKKETSGFLGTNPFADLEKFPERKRKTKLHLSQIPAFFAALDSVSDTMRDFILLALWTGRRAGDLKTMRWVDLDLDGETWLIPETKADEPQEVALSAPAIEVLAARKKSVSGPWVFPAKTKTGHIAAYQSAWNQVRAEAGLAGLRLHDFRRSLSSIAQENRIAATVAGAQLGHKDPATTIKHYTEIALYAQRAAVNVVADVILKAAKNG